MSHVPLPATTKRLATLAFLPPLCALMQWCGPCRKFTPMLSVTYEDRTDPNEVEVIFISSDNDLEAFNEYFADMPWTALPFAERDRAEKVGETFGVQGIPSLIVLDGATGAVVTKQGREKVAAAKKLNGIF